MTSNDFPAPVVQNPVFYERPTKGLAVAGFTLGVVGSVLGLIPIFGLIAIICGILALVFGIVGVKRVKRGVATGRGFAIAAIVLGLSSISLGAAGVVITSKAMNQFERDMEEIFEEDY